MIGWKGPLAWMAAGTALWIAAGLIDRNTEVEVYSNGNRVHLTVADTDLSASIVAGPISRIEIIAMDSVDPPGGLGMTIAPSGGAAYSVTLPKRFAFPIEGTVPVGDWELDEEAGHGGVWGLDIDLDSSWTLEASFRGRSHHDLTLTFTGQPGFSVAVRRGLINNDCFIRDSTGSTLAAASIDPTPVADLGAIGAIVSRAAAIALILIGFFSWLHGFPSPEPQQAGTHPRASKALVGVLALAATALSAWVAVDIFEKLPHLPDSATYLLQAQWLLDGQLWQPATEIHQRLSVPYTYVIGERWLAHYPPMWPAVLALGSAIDAPWIVSPLIGGFYIVLLFLIGREIDGPEVGLVAATLGLISPMARLIFGSMLSHAATATALLAALWLVMLARRRASHALALCAGIASGFAFGMRPLSAFATAIPLAGFLLIHAEKRRELQPPPGLVLGFIAGGTAAAVPALLANRLITGSITAFPYALQQKSMYTMANIPFGIRNLDAQLVSTANTLFGWGWDWVHGVIPAALALSCAMVPFLLRRNKTGDWLLLAMVLSLLVANLGLRGHGLHGFGPRYHFEAFAPLFLLTARGLFELARPRPSAMIRERRVPLIAAMALFFLLCLPAGAILPHRLGLYRSYNGVDSSLERQIEAAGVGEAVILLPTGNWRGWATAVRMGGADPEAPILFLEGDPGDPQVFSIAGGRPVFVWDEPFLRPVLPATSLEREQGGKVEREFADTHPGS